jgi:Fe-Mn family superoxide dismutase
VLIDGFPVMHGLEAEEICRRAFQLPRLIREDVRFSAGGIACHEYYFRYLTAEEGEHLPGEGVCEVLRRSFGSADSFFYIFREEAKRMQTGGFLWLCTENRSHVTRLRLVTTRGYDLPPAPYMPLLSLDLWEHAYINRFGEDRRAYADAFLRRLNWDAVDATLIARKCEI